MSGDCCLALPRGAMGMSAVCDCGIFLIILTYYFYILPFIDYGSVTWGPPQAHILNAYRNYKDVIL